MKFLQAMLYRYCSYVHAVYILYALHFLFVWYFFKIKFPIDVSVDDHLKEKKATKNELHFCKTKNQP